MSCDDVRAALIDSLVSHRAPSDPAVLTHLASCPACRSAHDDYSRLWVAMGDILAADPRPDAPARFRRRLAAARADSPPPAPRPVLPWVAGASAAAALVAALLGYQIGTRQAVQRVGIAQAPVTQTESTFLLLLHVDSNFRRGEPPAPRQALNAEYARWADGTGSVLTGKSLEPVVVWLGRPHPRSTAEDQVDGFFLVRAKNMAAAQQIAATCPHLKHGGWIEVREIGTT